MEREKGVTIDDGGEGAGLSGRRRGGKEESLGLKLGRRMCEGKKGGPCTPVPSWKLEEPGAATDPDRGSEHRRRSVSARKLGANLWEMQDLLASSSVGQRGSDKIRSRRGGHKALDLGPETSALNHEDRPQSAGTPWRHVMTSLNKHNNLDDINCRALQVESPASYHSSLEIAAFKRAPTPSSYIGFKGKFGEAGYSLKTSSELLKVLNRIWSLEEQHASNVSLVKALKVELEHARARIQELMQEQHACRHEMDNLIKQVAEDKLIRKKKEQQKIKTAVKSIKDELECERLLRKRSEGLHRKLGKELSEVKTALMKAVKNLERERKTNGLLEDLCDEFAKGIKDYEKEVRDLTQKFVKDRDHKVDRLVLHFAEAWLDERVQVNIAEVQGDLDEKDPVTKRLSSEIESFLEARRSSISKDDLYHKDEKMNNIFRRQSLESVHLNGATSAPQDAEDDDSVASDFHFFELNMAGGANVNHGHGQDATENFDSIRALTSSTNIEACFKNKKSQSSPEACFEKKKSQSSPSYSMQCEKQIDKTKSYRSKLLNYDGIHTGARAVMQDTNQIETTMPHKSDNSYSQNGAPSVQGSKHLIAKSAKNISEISECSKTVFDDYHVEGPCNPYTTVGKPSLVGETNALVNFRSSPIQQWKYQGTPDHDVSISSTKLAQGAKGNTLKAKLLEARLEGQHARLRASKGSSMGVARQ